MSAQLHGPVLARKRLAAVLRRLREERGYTQDYVADKLMISVSKLSRIEKAQGLPQRRDVRDLASLYELPDEESARLMSWADDARRKGWWTDYEAVLDPDQHEFIGYENEASTCLMFATPVVPGLLQEPSYASALLTSANPTWSAQKIAQVAQLRAVRQENLLDRTDKPRITLRAVLHETCLRQSVGPSEALLKQLRHLRSVAAVDNIELRIFPLAHPMHVALSSAFSHFSFGATVDRSVVFLETSEGMRYIEDDDTVNRFETWFNELVERSLEPQQSQEFIESVIADVAS